jgi:hypothetical protein
MTDLYRRNHEPDRAQAISALRLELWRNWDRRLPHNRFILRQLAQTMSEV